MSAEELQQIYSEMKKLAERLETIGADLPTGLGTLLQSGAFPTDLPLDEPKKSTSASVAQLGDSVQSATHLHLDLDDLVGHIPNITEDEFTVVPTDKGGQSAGKGFEFQDIYSIFLMTRFLDEDMPATLIRIEGAEDVDVMTEQGGSVCEWYYQVKTIKEGNNWTLRMFDTEGVWLRFAHCVSEFHAQCHDPTRSVQVMLVVDGDVSEDVQILRATPRNFSIAEQLIKGEIVNDPIVAKVRGEALSSIARRELWAHYADRELRVALESQSTECAKQLRNLCSALIQEADNQFVTDAQEHEEVSAADIIVKLLESKAEVTDSGSNGNGQTSTLPSHITGMIDSLQSLAPSQDHSVALRSSLTKTYPLLDPLFSSLRIHSRIGFAPEEIRIGTPQVEAEVRDELLVGISEIPSKQLAWRSYLEDAIDLPLVWWTGS